MNPFTQASELHEENGQLKLDLEGLKEELREVGVAFERLSNAVVYATKALESLVDVPLGDLEDSIDVIVETLQNVNGRA
jgi:hypothetical protein